MTTVAIDGLMLTAVSVVLTPTVKLSSPSTVPSLVIGMTMQPLLLVFRELEKLPPVKSSPSSCLKFSKFVEENAFIWNGKLGLSTYTPDL